MKLYQFYTKTVLVYVLLSFLITGYSYQASAEKASGETVRIIPVKEMPVILDLVANQISDNYERIITWSGEIAVKLNIVHTGVAAEEVFVFTDGQGETPESILQKIEERITFAFDANKGFVYVDNLREKPSKYFNNIDGNDLGNSGSSPYWSTKIAKPDYLIEAKPKSFDIKDNTIRRRKVVKKPSRQNQITGLYEDVDDPRKVFMPGGKPWEHFNKLIKHINKLGKIEFDGYSLKIEEQIKKEGINYKIIEPAIVSLKRSSPDHYIIIRKIFSGQYGFNMIYWEVTSGNGRLIQKFTWEYELINGVYLPKRVVEQHYGSNGEVSLEKESTYVNNKLNQTISPEMFEYTNLKLKDGDIFIDEILNKEYRYKADTRTLQPVEK